MQNKVKNKEFLVPVSCSLNNLEQKIGLWRLKILTPWSLKWTKCPKLPIDLSNSIK